MMDTKVRIIVLTRIGLTIFIASLFATLVAGPLLTLILIPGLNTHIFVGWSMLMSVDLLLLFTGIVILIYREDLRRLGTQNARNHA